MGTGKWEGRSYLLFQWNSSFDVVSFSSNKRPASQDPFQKNKSPLEEQVIFTQKHCENGTSGCPQSFETGVLPVAQSSTTSPAAWQS